MKESLVISDYCSIHKNVVVIRDKIVYSGANVNFNQFSNDIYKRFAMSYPKFHKMDNLSKLGFLTTELLLKDKNLDQKYSGDEVGIILTNASSSIDTDRFYQNTISDRTNYFPSPSIFVYTLPNIVIGEICIRHKFYGEGNFFVTRNFNPGFLVDYIYQLFESGAIKCCIAGWVEFDGNDFESVILLIEKADKSEFGIVKFEPAIIHGIYEKMK